MTSRQRIIKSFSYQSVDRTPLFERLIKSPTADIILGRPSAAQSFFYRMELLEEGEWQKLVDQEARDIVDLAKILNFDMICLGPNIPEDYEKPIKIGENRWKKGEAIIRYLPSSDVVQTVHSEVGKSLEKDIRLQIEWIEEEYKPPVFKESELYVFRKAKEIMEREGLDLAIYVSNYTLSVATLPAFMLEWFYTCPDLLKRFYRKNTQYGIDRARQFVDLGADVIGLGGDVASDAGPIISPAHYREFIVPCIKEQADALREMGVFSTNTSDGNLWSAIDNFLIDSGVDGYGEIDKAAGMDLGQLKGRYGDRICFLGNLDIRYTLCSGSIDEVKKETIECIEKGWGNGGHILMTSNCVHKDVNPENYLAALKAHREYFGY